jgi:hypothetical protein
MRRRLGGAAVALVALVALGAGALHGGHVEAGLTTHRDVTQAQRADAYYDCLTAEAHSLIHAGDVVFLPHPTLGEWATVTKVIGGWAAVTLHLKAANEGLAIDHAPGPGTCQGDVIVTVTRLPDGHLVIGRGHAPRA